MESAKELREELSRKLKELQKICPHERTRNATYEWAMGHGGPLAEVCLNCEKIIQIFDKQ